MIRTRYRPATSEKPASIVASQGSREVAIPYPADREPPEAHHQAAMTWLSVHAPDKAGVDVLTYYVNGFGFEIK